MSTVILTSLLAFRGAAGGAVDPALSEKEIFERAMIQRALSLLGLALESEPEGKRIERVEVVRFPIVEESDPWPNFFNMFHVTTREHIVRQELLFEAGQAHDEDKVRESARNLRLLPLLFSTVRIVTARGEDPHGVVVVVITKDLWSIRLNSNGNFGGGVFNFFYVTPSEQNFLGFNQQVSLHYYIDRDVHTFGQIYRVPRLFGSRLRLIESLALRTNHHSGDVEGGWGSVLLQRPLFSVDTEWGFFVQAGFDIGIDRFYQGVDYHRVEIPAGDAVFSLPEMYWHESFSMSAVVQRSFGRDYKTDLSAGYNLHSRTYGLTDEFAHLPADVRRDYQRLAVPVDDEAGAVIAGVRFYEARFARMHNVQTLGLTEDYGLGPRASFDLAWANPLFGFSQHSLRLTAGLGYRLKLGDDLLVASGQVSARLMLSGVDTDWVDQLAEVQLENVSPSLLGLGRLFVRLRYVYSQYSRTHARLTLGGENTLRGFLSGFASGPRLLNVNVEFRSAPWVIYTMHLGFVVFYDGGDAYGFEPEDDFKYHQSMGFGVRWLFPQFDRGTLRIDVGIPLGADFNSRVVEWVTIAFLQAF